MSGMSNGHSENITCIYCGATEDSARPIKAYSLGFHLRSCDAYIVFKGEKDKLIVDLLSRIAFALEDIIKLNEME
jgi:hypothetical protein